MDFPVIPDNLRCLELTDLAHNLFHGVQRLATSAYKPARLGKSLLLGLSRRSGQTYPLVADRVASQPYSRCSAARHCEIRPTTCKNRMKGDFCSGR